MDTHTGRIRRALVGVALGGLGLPVAWAGASPWPEDSYTYYADHKPLRTLLADFCRTFGLKLQASTRVQGQVDGRLSAPSPSAFLDQLAASHRLAWFQHAGVLYVGRSDERTSRRIEMAAGMIATVSQALRDRGLMNERFGWSELPGQGGVVVSGPPPYVSLVAAAIKEMNLSSGEWQIEVFALRYAMVEDRTLAYRDREIVIPGVATLLRRLMAADDNGEPRSLSLAGELRPVPGVGANADKAATRRPNGARPRAASTGPRAVAGSTAGAVIESDVRLNAIVVKDNPSMMPLYRRLIQRLDVPMLLVEIEAMIMDINKNRLRDLGIDWTLAGRGWSASFGAPAAQPSPGTLSVSYTSIVHEVRSLLARIRALEEEGDAKVQSKPMILTTDNLTALIDLSETFYARVSGERVANLVPVTAGVMLKVTPHVVPADDGPPDIQLTIDIEDGTLDSRTGVELPVVKRSVISTQAVIRAEQSLLIGGYDSQRAQRVEQKVPVLGNLPLIGRLFRSDTTIESNRERLFLITPRLTSLTGGTRPSVGNGPVAPGAAPSAPAAPAATPDTPVSSRAPANQLPLDWMQ